MSAAVVWCLEEQRLALKSGTLGTVLRAASLGNTPVMYLMKGNQEASANRGRVQGKQNDLGEPLWVAEVLSAAEDAARDTGSKKANLRDAR